MNSQQTEDDTLGDKHKGMMKRLHEVEDANKELQVKLDQARKKTKYLYHERFILLDRLEEYQKQGPSNPSHSRKAPDNSDSGASGSESMASDMAPSTKSSANRPRAKQTQKDSTPAPARKKKDPNAPKGPGNVFFLYCRLERDKIKDEMPNDSLGEVTRALGQKWKALTKEEKQKYYDMYKEEQKEYEKEMKTYNATGAATSDIKPSVKREDEEETVDGGDADEEIDMLQDEDEDEDADMGDTVSEDIAISTAPVPHSTNIVAPMDSAGSENTNEPKLSSQPSPSLHHTTNLTTTQSPLSQVQTLQNEHGDPN